MSLPDEISVAMAIHGLRFEFRVHALPEGCARLFPERECADEFQRSPDLPGAVARVAACVLDSAVAQFHEGFQVSLSSVLVKALDGEKLSPSDTAPAGHQEVA